jgi:hypothetical protein
LKNRFPSPINKFRSTSTGELIEGNRNINNESEAEADSSDAPHHGAAAGQLAEEGHFDGGADEDRHLKG